MKRLLILVAVLAIATTAFGQAPGTCYFAPGGVGIVCQSGAYLTMSSGSTLTMNGTAAGGTFTLVNPSGGSANPWDFTGTLGIMNGSDDFTVIDINLTNANHTGVSNTVQAIGVANITGDADATEIAIKLGTGWDHGLYSGSLIEGLLGLTITGAAVNLNASSNFAVNVGTGTSTGTVTLGSGTGAQALVMAAGTGDLTFTSTDDFIWTATDDITLNGGSTGSIINIGTNTHGNVFNIGTNNTTADDINIGSALDDVTIAAEDISLNSADDVDITSTSAGGIIAIGGTPGNAVNIGTDDTTADTITVGSAKDTLTLAVEPRVAAGVGTAGTGVTATEALSVRTVTLTFALTGANDIDVADGDKSTGVKVFDFPQGRILLLGAVIDASVTTNDAYNANPNDIYYVGVGTVDGTQAADADLTATEQNIIAKTTLDTASNVTLTHDWHAGMGTLAYADNVFDGTTTATAVFVNVAVPDASNTKASTHAITGTLRLTYVNLGDY